GAGVAHAAVDHAVPRGDHLGACRAGLDPREHRAERIVMRDTGGQPIVSQLHAGLVFRDEARARPQAVDLTADEQRRRGRALADFEYRELDRGRARVEDEEYAAQYFGPRRANRSAMAHEAMRVRGSSARLVRTIGTRAPSTSPAR